MGIFKTLVQWLQDSFMESLFSGLCFPFDYCYSVMKSICNYLFYHTLWKLHT